MARKSRYNGSLPYTTNVGGEEVFRGNRARVIARATPVVEHQVKKGDRLDLLADHYYGNDRLWWRILDANPGFIYAGALLADEMTGQIILIPRGRE